MPSSLRVPFKHVSLVITPKNRIIGGTPSDPKLIEGWLKSNMPEVAEAEREKLAATTLAQVQDVVDAEAKGMWNTFRRDETGLFLCDYQIKAAFKEAANILRDTLIKQESKGKNDDEKKATKSRFTNLRSKIAEHLFVETPRIYIMKNGSPMKEPSGNEERSIHVITAQGPRTAIKRFDFVEPEGVELRMKLRYLDVGVVDLDLLTVLVEYMGWNGIGADRSLGFGQFVGTVKAIEG